MGNAKKLTKIFLHKIPKPQEAKADNWHFIKLKSFCTTKETTE
jgi:hypothetical protein